MSIHTANAFLAVALLALLARLWYLHESSSKRQDELIRTMYGFLLKLQQRLGQDRLSRANASRRLQELLDGPDPTARVASERIEPLLTPGEVAERICGVLTKEPAQLERVISFSMWMTLEYTREVVGLTDEELREVGDQVAPSPFLARARNYD
jgi:hypothetical protein